MKSSFKIHFILCALALISTIMVSAQKTGFSDRKWYLEDTKTGRDYITLLSDGKYQLEFKNKTENGVWKYDESAKTVELQAKPNKSRIYYIEKIGFAELVLNSPEKDKLRFIIKTEM